MERTLLILVMLFALGCLADPTDYPYNGPLGSSGQRDSGGTSGGDVSTPDATRDTAPDTTPDAAGDAGPKDAGPTDAGPQDTGPVDSGPADAGPADAGPADAGPGQTDAMMTDAGPADMGSMDAATDTALPPTPDRIRCTPMGQSCEPIECDGACEVDCSRPGTRCSVDCATDERCELKCTPGTELCEMVGCANPVQCNRNLVCNGECAI